MTRKEDADDSRIERRSFLKAAGASAAFGAVFNKVTNEGDVHWSNWSSSNEDRLRKITENCMHEAGLYTRGYIKEIY